MNPVRTLLAAATASLALSAAAEAAPLPEASNAEAINGGFQAMRDFNLIVLKDLQSSSEVQGRTFVGGNLKGGSSNYFSQPGGQTGVALTVGGDVTGGAKNINNGGALQVGGDLDSGANMNGGGQVHVDGSARKVNANGASVYVDGDVEHTNAKDIYHGGAIKHSNGTGHAGDHTAQGLQAAIQAQAAIYEQELLAASDFLADLESTHTMSLTSHQATFDAGVGTVLAPNAELKINNFIHGSVVVRNLQQNGAIRMGAFGADASVNALRAVVPEPATWAMMILGFGAVGSMIRRRRAALA